MLRAIFQKEQMLLDRGVGQGRLVVLFALGLAAGAAPWLVEAAGLDRAEARRSFFESFLTLQWVLATLVLPWVTAKLLAREAGGRGPGWLSWTDVAPAQLFLGKLALVMLVALELVLAAGPLVLLQWQMGMATLQECVLSQGELLAFSWTLAPLTVLLQLTLERPLAALGAAYAGALALCLLSSPVAGSASATALWLGAAAVGTGLVALRSHRRYRHADG